MNPIKRRSAFNPKRRAQENCGPEELEALAQKIHYKGSPQHKRNPGDFNLDPPAQPRQDKELCDDVEVFTVSVAMELLQKGVRKGLISEQWRGNYPQNIWSVTDNGQPLEAQLENQVAGTYHGYPMPGNDPFRKEIINRYNDS